MYFLFSGRKQDYDAVCRRQRGLLQSTIEQTTAYGGVSHYQHIEIGSDLVDIKIEQDPICTENTPSSYPIPLTTSSIQSHINEHGNINQF